MITRKRELETARAARQIVEEEAAALDRKLLGIESEIGDALQEAPRCAHPKQPCEYKSCGMGQRRAALEWALSVVRGDGNGNGDEAAS